MKLFAVMIVLCGFLAINASLAGADGGRDDTAPPGTDFHTVVTQPGSGGEGGPVVPVCVWRTADPDQLALLKVRFGSITGVFHGAPDGYLVLVPLCDGAWDGASYRIAAVVTAADLARDGYVELSGVLPVPQPRTTPPAGQPSIATVAAFVWTDPAAWTPITVTRTDPDSGLAATATATPSRMTFDPGDGAGPHACSGPGVGYDPLLASGDSNAQADLAGRCSHIYTRLTRNADGSRVAGRPPAWNAVLSITWDVTWTATNGESGVFAPIVKATTFDRPVTEIQVLVTG